MRFQFTVILIACMAAFATRAEATWLNGAIRSQSNYDFGASNTGSGCLASGGFYYCPFVSDSTAFFGGDSANMYVDYRQTHASGGWVVASACRQSWTGGSYACAAGTTTTSTGWQDVGIASFSAAGTADVYDYFFVIVTKSGVGESIDQVIGFAAF